MFVGNMKTPKSFLLYGSYIKTFGGEKIKILFTKKGKVDYMRDQLLHLSYTNNSGNDNKEILERLLNGPNI